MYVISVIYARLELRTKLHTEITISILEMSTTGLSDHRSGLRFVSMSFF